MHAAFRCFLRLSFTGLKAQSWDLEMKAACAVFGIWLRVQNRDIRVWTQMDQQLYGHQDMWMAYGIQSTYCKKASVLKVQGVLIDYLFPSSVMPVFRGMIFQCPLQWWIHRCFDRRKLTKVSNSETGRGKIGLISRVLDCHLREFLTTPIAIAQQSHNLSQVHVHDETSLYGISVHCTKWKSTLLAQ